MYTPSLHDALPILNNLILNHHQPAFVLAVRAGGKKTRFFIFEIALVMGRGQVFFLRAFGVDARRWLRWILNPSRRSFKLRVLVDRQRPMKNVTLDRATVLQLDANGTDSALDVAADCDALRNDVALDLCAIANQEI